MNSFAFVVLLILLLLILAVGIVMVVMRNKYTNPNLLLTVGIILIIISTLGLLLLLWAYFRPVKPMRTIVKVSTLPVAATVSPRVTPQIAECTVTQNGLIPELIQPIAFG